MSKQESTAFASGSSFTKTQKQTSIPEASEDNGPFRLVIPSSLYSQQSRIVPPIRNVTVHRELTPITRTAKPYRSNVHRKLTPITRTIEPNRSNIHKELTLITRTTEPYRSNVRIAKPYRSNVRTAEPYRRELMPIIREPYSSNWTRDKHMISEKKMPTYRKELTNYRKALTKLLPLCKLPPYGFGTKFCKKPGYCNHLHHPPKYATNTFYTVKGKNLVRDSKDEMEVDEEKARTKMKTILKTFLIELELKYDEKFTKKAHQVKGAKSLFNKNDEKLENYDRKELLNVLSDNRYHFPEYFESDEKQPDGAPNWTYVEQNMLADTDFSELEMPIQMMENLIMVEDAEVLAEIDKIVVIEDSELTGMKESEPMEMEESEPMGMEELEPMEVEELPEMEDETDKWYKFVL
ncbi:unnamed protein product [Rhizophagus irregularis]|uniref:C3H1-type domain-containing protein n=1 Tax=Rhizophagus irregularis TaxID=588596 RepID=A0A915Z357_9GLOM|nr:unnamed protein product [Rhizophagus irregularis]